MSRSLDPSRTLAARFPALAAQWHPERNGTGPSRYDPDTIAASSSATVWWRCSEGHEWRDKVATRTAMPKWKNDDVAACPECIRSPTRLVVHTYPGCGHTRTAQRRNAEKNQQNCWDCGADLDRACDGKRLERKRASGRASYYRRKINARRLTSNERAAQRALVGFLNCAPANVHDSGITWWRSDTFTGHHVTTTTQQLSEWMIALDIPHRIAIRASKEQPKARTIGVHIRAVDIEELSRWAPTFCAHVGQRRRR
ncbi:zinc-ribbon domain-containing protein [Actinomycetospora sp. CA-053990]|uniref:zinc-ribbon domain-containing protein n=1 Tax=Actinomycetospora sp. CA-053990 TaxID=3239891 RepID=UPI003D8E334B